MIGDGTRTTGAPAAPRRRTWHLIGLLSALLIGLVGLAAPAQAASPDQAARPIVVFLRVEGARGPIFNGPVVTRAHAVTSAQGGTHKCDGTNNGANPVPGPTALGALDDGTRIGRYTWDGPYYPSFEDYLVTRIGRESATSTTFWSLSVNGRTAQVGGCQQRVAQGDRVTWKLVPVPSAGR